MNRKEVTPIEQENAVRRQYLEYQIQQEDADDGNHTYQDEQTLLELVRKGNVEQILENNRNKIFPEYSEFVHTDLKTEEYVAVITISIVARAAIEGGVTSVDSFRLSDLYLRQLARVRDVQSILKIREEAIVAFATLVKELKPSGKTGLYVEDCKRYIVANVYKKISVKDVAGALHLNAIYLERVFRESEGVTIGAFIRRQKVERAKALLAYTDRTIMDISHYLSFSSQSHFGNVFRSETGMTPKQYREEQRVRNY